MKVKKILTILIIFCMFFPAIVYADTTIYPGGDNNSNPPKIPNTVPSSGAADNNGYPSRADLTKGKTVLVGLLTTLVEYNVTESGASDKEVGNKLLLLSGSLGSQNVNIEVREYSSKVTDDTVYFDPNRKKYTKHKETFYEIVGIYRLSVHYNAPTLSARLQGAKTIGNVSLAQGSIHTSIANNVFKTYFPKLSNVNNLFGVNVTRETMHKYYFKFEPIYRYYPALYKYEDSDFEYDDDDWDFVVDDDIDEEEDGTYGTGDVVESFENAEEEVNQKDWTYEECGHETEEFDITRIHPTALSEEDCPSPYHWGMLGDSEDCFYTEKESYKLNIYYMLRDASVNFGSVPTSAATAREKKAFYTSLYSPFGNGQNKHEVVNENGTKGSGSDYFLGPTYQKAIAAAPQSTNKSVHKFNSAYNTYNLVNSNGTLAAGTTYENSAIGMGLYYLPEWIDPEEEYCSDVCGTHNKSSDEFLKCAVNFCDAFIEFKTDKYSTNDKRDCVLTTKKAAYCGYKPGKPVDCDNLNLQSGEENYKDTVKASSGTVNGSSCGFESNGSSNRTVNSASKSGSYYTCEHLGMSKKVDGLYPYGTSRTDNSYISVECRETTHADFTDLSGERLNPGEGFMYETVLMGDKQCRIFFDTYSWKLDFATTHSLDQIRKRLLIQKLNTFNRLVGYKEVDENTHLNGSEILGKKVLHEYSLGRYKKVDLQYVEDISQTIGSLKYDIQDGKSSVNSKVEEKVKDSSSASTKGNDSYGGTPFDLELKSSKTEGNLVYSGTKNDVEWINNYVFNEAADEYHELTDPTTTKVNKYFYNSNASMEYMIPKVCISKDNNRIIEKTDTNTCDSAQFLTSPFNKYFTAMNSEASDSLNNIITNIHVKKTDINHSLGADYLSGEDSCHYQISEDSPPPTPLKCEIDINEDYIGNENITEGECYDDKTIILTDKSKFEAIIQLPEDIPENVKINSHRIEAQGLGIYNTSGYTIQIPIKKLKFKSNSDGTISTNSQITINGKFTTSDGKEYKCSRTISVADKSSASGCTIKKISESSNSTKGFVITVPEEGMNVYAGVGSQVKDNNVVLYKLTPSETNKKQFYYKTNTVPLKNDVIIAKAGSGYCYYIESKPTPTNTCWNKFRKDTSGCVTEETYLKILNYCRTQYPGDTRCTNKGWEYQSVQDCVYNCTYTTKESNCPVKCKDKLTVEKRQDVDAVIDYCKYDRDDNAETEEQCLQTCPIVTKSNNYQYRPINLNNPFPNSSYSGQFGYLSGNRNIGIEWVATYQSLLDSHKKLEDKNVSYSIVLTPTTISEIINNTNKSNISLYAKESNVYVDTTNNYNNKVSCYPTGVQQSAQYCSKFINEDFKSLFCYINGLKNSGVIGVEC